MRNVLRVVCGVCLVLGLCAGVASLGWAGDDEGTVREIAITITPSTLILGADGPWVTVHTDITLSAVATSSLELSGVAVAWCKADSRGNLVGKFRQADVKAIVSPPSATLVLTGVTRLGEPFQGSDPITVNARRK